MIYLYNVMIKAGDGTFRRLEVLALNRAEAETWACAQVGVPQGTEPESCSRRVVPSTALANKS